MKAATTALKNLIKNDYEIRAVPKLTAEWEHNRFSKIGSVAVTPAQDTDSEWTGIYPLKSVTIPNRPRTGIAKARLDNAKVKTTEGYRDYPAASRFYVPAGDDIYSYFSTIQKSAGTATGPGYAFSTPISLDVVYEQSVTANKLVIGLEVTYARPSTHTVQISTDGTTWTTVASSPPIDLDGRIILYRNIDGNWTDTVSYNYPQQIRGVRLVVHAMNTANSSLDVLDIGARLENDLSDLLIDYKTKFEVSEPSFIAPLGRASSNTASITLSNIDDRFDGENEDALYYGLIDKKVKFVLDLSYNVPLGSPDERLREFTMWADSWGAQEQSVVTVELKDSSVFLQETEVPKVFWENFTIGAIVWQLMDTLGYTNYLYSRTTQDLGQVIPYFWPKEGDTVWDTIGDLAEKAQTAIYFDEYDVLQIKTRKAMFREDAPVDWNLDSIKNGQKLPDIIESKADMSLAVNSVDINYQPASYSDFNNGLPKMEVVWEPEDETVTLRASALIRDLLANGTDLWIRASDAIHWPYEAMVNIRGEVMRYKGKEYVWYKPGGGTETVILTSKEDKDKYDKQSDTNLAWKNNFTGKFKLTERGLGGTPPTAHGVTPANYTGLITNYFNTEFVPWGTPGALPVSGGVATITPPSRVTSREGLYLLKHETSVRSDNTVYGTRFRFPEKNLRSDGYAAGGIFFAGEWSDAGYYLEISTTDHVENIDKRTYKHEICLISIGIANGPHHPIKGSDGTVKGSAASIVPGQWYTLDVAHRPFGDGTNRSTVDVFLDGVLVGVWVVPQAQRPADEGRFGLFTRFQTKMEFEYLYAVHTEPTVQPDATSFLDLVKGGFTSGYIERDWKYGSTSTAINWYYGTKVESRKSWGEYAYDEFGPVVHEIREFEVVFKEDFVPVSHSYLYLSNESQVACLNYWSDAFGAKFTLANTTRQNAIVQGEDTLTFTGNSVNHKIFLYGRALYQEDEHTITKKDEESIRRKGTISLAFDNRFIQTEQAATELADWVLYLWGGGVDELTVPIFGNPLIQLGDLVTMNFPAQGMLPSTHKYYVVAKNNRFTTGLETDLVLRRARI